MQSPVFEKHYEEYLARISRIDLISKAGSIGAKAQGCLKLLQGVLKNINAPVLLEVINAGDHSFNTPKSLKLNHQDIYNQILEKLLLGLNLEKLKVIKC